MSVWEDAPSTPASSPFPRASAGVYGDEAKQMAAAGWENSWGDTWTNKAKPGQYLSTGNVRALMAKQSSANSMMDASNYNPGINYMNTVQPYLANAQTAMTANGGASTVDGTNPYEQRLQALLDNPDSIKDTGAYKFRFNQGQQALERSAAAKGMTGSGNVLAALSDYGHGQASQAYGDEATRLAGLTGQQNNYILGLKGAANNEFNSRVGAANSVAGVALGAARSQAEDYWKGQTMANDAKTRTGYVNQYIW